jgi:hypothetical protein
MSKSNASAKNRRAYGGNPPPVPSSAPQQTPTQQQQQPANGFTLQQVIAVIDRRLMNLESFVSENKDLTGRESSRNVRFETAPQQDNSIQEVLDEYNNRFNMLAEEIVELKDIVLKLQSYTMDVNKTLLEERIHILSDLGTNSVENEPQLFEISNNTEPETVNTTANVELQNLE